MTAHPGLAGRLSAGGCSRAALALGLKWRKMVSGLTSNFRYAAYAIAAVLGLLAYVWLEPDSSVPAQAPRLDSSSALPASHLPGENNAAKPGRDLFFNSGIEQQERPEAEPAIAATVEEAVQPAADPFAGLKIIGFLRAGPSVTVLLAMGETLETIHAGEPFGPAGALRVSQLKGSGVEVVDAVSRASRTFTLTEE
jgi:hypothetical protein